MKQIVNRNNIKQNIINPSVGSYIYQLFVYIVIIACGYKISSLHVVYPLDIFRSEEFIFSIIIVYLISCFWTNQMIISDKNITIIYPTRLFCRKYLFLYKNINKVVFTTKGKGVSRFVIYTKKGYINHTVERGGVEDVKRTIRFLQEKGICLEFRFATKTDMKKYLP